MPGKFLDPLELEYIDGRNWKLTAAFDYHLGEPEGIERVNLPAGFITDFASIPRPLWNLLPPTGPYGKAAVVHDWLYRRRVITCGDLGKTRLVERSEADRILLEAMQVLNVNAVERGTIYAGVRVGGWVAWRAARARA